MPETTSTSEPAARTRRIEMNLTGSQKVFIGCFGIWCATGVANTFIRYKALDKALALETLKAAANKMK